MLRSFIGWLDGHLSDSGPVGLLGAILGVLAFGATLSAVFGSATIKAAAVIAALIGVLGLLLQLLAERSSYRRREDLHQRLLTRYCDAFMNVSNEYWRILQWHQAIIIEPDGDTKSLICLQCRSEVENPGFFRMRFGAGWSQPSKYRKKVHVQVRSAEIDGVGGGRYDQSLHWLDDERLDVLVHFSSAIPREGVFQVLMEVDWPAKCLPLLKFREPDEFVLRPDRGMDRLEYVIVLPPGEDAYFDPVGFDMSSPDFSVTSRTTNAGQVEITLTGVRVPPAKRLGLRLDLKPRRTRRRWRGLPRTEAAYLSALVSSPPPANK